MTLGLVLAGTAAAQEFRYEARHDHLRKACTGTLRIDVQGVSFEETPKKPKKRPHAWRWTYTEIQQLRVAPKRLQVLTYKDSRWRLGADRAYNFRLAGGTRFEEVYGLLKDRLDQRFVAELADESVNPLWEVPVKLLGRISGSEGVLAAGADRVVYRTTRPGDSRTWRYSDIDNISRSGPFQLTVTTFERAAAHYGNRKSFNFQLKEPIAEDRYNDLWRRLNQNKGLKILTLHTEKERETNQ
jgi:hypothetical protein